MAPSTRRKHAERSVERKSARMVQKPKVYVARIDSRRSYSFSEESTTERRAAKRSARLQSSQPATNTTRSSPRKRKFYEAENSMQNTTAAPAKVNNTNSQLHRFNFQYQPPTTETDISPNTFAGMKRVAQSQFETKLKQATKLGLESMDEAEVLEQVPDSMKDLFGQVGFAKWTRLQLPALVLSPYKVPPGPVRKSWLEQFHMSIRKGRQPDKVIVYWYGESTPKTFYSLVHQSSFVLYEEASIKVRDFAQKALEQHAMEKPLSINEAKKYRAWMEMEEDLRKKPEERERGEAFIFEMFLQPQQHQHQRYNRQTTPILHDLAVMDDSEGGNPPVVHNSEGKGAEGNMGDLIQDDSTLSSGDRSSMARDLQHPATQNMGSKVMTDAASQQLTESPAYGQTYKGLGPAQAGRNLKNSSQKASQLLRLEREDGDNGGIAKATIDQVDENHDSVDDQEVQALIQALVQKGVPGDDEGVFSKLQAALVQKQNKIESLLHRVVSLKDSNQRECESIRAQRDAALQKSNALEAEIARRGEEHRNTVRDLKFERDSAVEKARELERKIGAARSALGW